MEYEFDPCVTSEVRATALILLLDQGSFPFDTDKRLVESELPPLKDPSIACGGPIRKVELEAGPVESERLTDRADVCLFQAQKDAKSTQDDVFA